MPRTLDLESLQHGTELVKRGFARMQKGGVVMDVTNAEEAGIAEDAGAVAVMALERVPADIRAHGGVARMSDPDVIESIVEAVTVPVMAKTRIGHLVEAQMLQQLGVDMIDESEVLTPADPFFHTYKRDFDVPFVCGARSLGEAVRRIFEGAAMIRTKGEAGTGNIVEAVRHRRVISQAVRRLQAAEKDEILEIAAAFSASYFKLSTDVAKEENVSPGHLSDVPILGELDGEEIQDGVQDVLLDVKRLGRLPVVDFAAGGIATPADAALMMQLGNDGVFVGSGIFKSGDPQARARAIVEATTHFDDPETIVMVSRNLGEAMVGINVDQLPAEEKLQHRGW